MKKLLIVLLICLWPCAALADIATPYDTATMLYYPELSQEEQELFDLLYLVISDGAGEINMPEGTDYDMVCRVMELIKLDCPELCSLGMEYTVTYLQDNPWAAVSIELNYTLYEEAPRQLLEAARSLVSQAQGDEFHREWILHDLLCSRVTYDLEADNRHGAYGALVDGRAVCDGYARAMTLLLRLSGIRCGMVTGKVVGLDAKHAWNLVQIDGSWTWLDPTNNDQSELITYFYFNLTDEWLARSYIPEVDADLPACTDESVSWHAKTWRLVQRTEDMEVHIFNNFRNLLLEGSMFNLRFANAADYLSFRDETAAWAERYNRAYDPDVQGALRTWYNDEQQCVVVQLGE